MKDPAVPVSDPRAELDGGRSAPSSLGGRASLRLLDGILRLYPADFRRQLGDELRRSFAQRLRYAETLGGPVSVLRRSVGELLDALRGALVERFGRASPSILSPLTPHPPAGDPEDRPHAMSRTLESTLRHLRYALRQLAKSPGFTGTAILTLGLAIGANTAVFSLVDAMLLQPLPYPDADGLARVVARVTQGEQTWEQTSATGRTWEIVRDGAGELQVAVYSGGVAGVNMVAGSEPLHVNQQRVGAGFFRTLGVPPLHGRGFSPEEDRPGGPPVTVLSHGLWSRVLGADPGVLGDTVMLRGEPYTVVGIMPADFWNPWGADLWTPLRPSTSGEGSGSNYSILARVPKGMPDARVATRMEVISATLNDTIEQPDRSATLTLEPLQDLMSASARQPLLMLAGAVALVLLIACVNLAGLLIARAGRRRQEIATHMALGGGKAAIFRLLLTESLLLGVLGGGLGVAVGTFGLEALKSLGSFAFDAWRPVVLDLRVLAVTALLSLGTALAFGLVPALQASRLDIQRALVEGGARGVAGSRSHKARRTLLVAQMALGVVLLVSAGLLIRSLLHLRNLEPGFEPEGLASARVSLEDARYQDAEAVHRLFRESLQQIREIPGVESAAVSLGLPYERLLNLPFELVGEELDQTITNMGYVTPGFFETLRIPVRRGRALGDWDRADAAHAVVVNEAFVGTYLPDSDPVGRVLRIAGEEREIVGVVGDVQQRPGWGTRMPLTATPMVYTPVSQIASALAGQGFFEIVHQWFAPAWIVRSARPLDGLMADLEAAIGSVDPLLPVTDVQNLEQVQAQALSQERVLAILLASLAGAALFLAAVGIHALIAGSVTERTREMGIRMALGATGSDTVRAVALPGLVLALVGLVVGGVLSYGAVRLIRAFLWGISPTDPVTLVGVALSLLLVAAVASFLPALRVLRLDPAKTLRRE